MSREDSQTVTSAGECISPDDEPSNRTPDGNGRLQRRRLRVLVLLFGAGVGAVAGGFVGWSTQTPLYRCEGGASVQYTEDRSPHPPMFKAFGLFQVELLTQRRTTLAAMEEEVWTATGEPAGQESAAHFEDRRRVAYESDGDRIRVEFLDARPEVALAGVRALLAAYERRAAAADDTDKHLEHVGQQVKALRAMIEAIDERIQKAIADYGSVDALTVRHMATVQQAIDTEEDLNRIREAIRRVTSSSLPPLEDLQRQEHELAERLEELQAMSRKLGSMRVEVERLQIERAGLVRDLEAHKRILGLLEARLADSGRVVVVDRGTLPNEPHRGSRAAAAVVGATIGALLGMVVSLLLGLLRQRSRSAVGASA